jgi:hypothetical protein
MGKALRIMAVVFVAFALAGGGIGFAQDKPAAGQDKKETVAADPLTGDWDGSVKTQSGTISFTMKLKLEKDKFSGEIASQEGGTPITGTWSDGKFSGNFDYNGSAVVMTGAFKDAVLTGEMNRGAEQTAMPWTARKK